MISRRPSTAASLNTTTHLEDLLKLLHVPSTDDGGHIQSLQVVWQCRHATATRVTPPPTSHATFSSAALTFSVCDRPNRIVSVSCPAG